MTPSSWRMDPRPEPLCSCAHPLALHNIDTRKQPCSTCPCAAWSHTMDRWRFTGYTLTGATP